MSSFGVQHAEVLPRALACAFLGGATRSGMLRVECPSRVGRMLGHVLPWCINYTVIENIVVIEILGL